MTQANESELASHDAFTKMFPLSFDGYELPEHTQHSIENYYYRRIPPGGFVTAVLANDFISAVNSADWANSRCLTDIARWLSNRMPTVAYGSYKKVEDWINNGV